ncbi:MAG: hypothetical protein IJS22_05355 [Lachnospiraceae bacterium]|nr:hypothetical protein [Lachnospiraceae bacterium]
MKDKRIWFYITLILGIVCLSTSLIVWGSSGREDTLVPVESGEAPSDAQQGEATPAGPTEPARPGDPGAIPPLPEPPFPEDGVVWDMESIPDDLLESRWVIARYADHDEFKDGNVSFFGADGKGYKGSRALGIKQNGSYSWADEFDLGISLDATAFTSWTKGDILWFYVDGKGLGGNVNMEFRVDDVKLAKDGPFYLMEDGESEAEPGGVIPEGYTGYGYGRIPIDKGYKGWIGIPLNALGENFRKVRSFMIHFGGMMAGSTLYIDQFMVMEDCGPYGAKLNKTRDNKASSGKAAWDMEKLADDPVSDEQIVIDGASYESPGYKAGNIKVSGAAGKGVNGSRALRLKQNGEYSWADVFTMTTRKDKSLKSDWTGRDMVWFWIDATEVRNDIRLELVFNDVRPAIGASIYGINGSKEIEKVGKTELAYDGAKTGRILIGGGYKGFVGLPLSAWGKVTEVSKITFHVSYSGSRPNAGQSIYFDEFWILNEGEKPGTAMAGDMFYLRGGTGGIADTSGAKADSTSAAWDMENIPDNLEGNIAVNPSSSYDDYKKNNSQVLGAAGKGRDGSRALALVQNGNYSWTDTWNLDLTKDSKAKTNWSSGKIVWIWINAAEAPAKSELEVRLNDKGINRDYRYYEVKDGKCVEAGEFNDSWNGNGRLPISRNLTGFIGIPLEAFSRDGNGKSIPSFTRTGGVAETMYLHWGGSRAGCKLYLDEIWVTGMDEVPVGAPDTQIISDNTGGSATFAARSILDMEKLSGDLFSQGIISVRYADQAPSAASNIAAAAEEGKGLNGSKALVYTFKGAKSGETWAYSLDIDLNKIGADTNWKDAGMLWFYIDNTEFKSGGSKLDIWVDDCKVAIGAEMYGYNGNGITELGTVPKAWDSADYGRLQIPTNYKGFIGLKLTDFTGLALSGVSSMYLYSERSSGFPASLYIDEFWLTKLNEAPDVTIEGSDAPEQPDAFTKKCILNMEKLSGSLFASGAVTALYADQAPSVSTNLAAEIVSGKGLGESKALAYTFKGRTSGEYWAYSLTLNLSMMKADTDWTGAGMLWFYLDNTELGESGNRLDLWVDDCRSVIGAKLYGYDGTSITELGEASKAWDSADYGRFDIPANYKGFIGVKLADEKDYVPGETGRIYLYTEVSSGFPASLYIDDLWLTNVNEAPDMNGSESGGEEPGEDPEPSGETVRIHVMDMESDELNDIPKYEYAYYVWGSSSNPGDSALSLSKVAGKGVNGSAAIEYKLLGTGEKPIMIRMEKIDDYPTDLTGTEVFWFWLDASGISRSVKLEPRLYSSDWKLHKLQIAKPYYLWNGGERTTASTVTAWTGQTFGRLSLPQGYVGYVGIPYASFYEGGGDSYNETAYKVSDIKGMFFNIPNPNAGETMYIDDFWATDSGSLPDVKLQTGTASALPGTAALIMDMEDAALDTPTGEMLNSWDLSKVTLAKTAGKGADGSAAIGYTVNEKVWSASCYIRTDGTGKKMDWSNGSVVWFWIDTNGYGAFDLQVALYNGCWHDVKLEVGKSVYLSDGSANTEVATKDAWASWGGTAGYGAVPLPASYKGWVGIPVGSFKSADNDGHDVTWTTIRGLCFYNDAPAGTTMYIDEMRLTEQ